MSDAPIAVFDSGVGGLTVLKALRHELPGENFVYLGDTARLPYGTKSAATVARYALQAAEALVSFDIKHLVVACNTASAAGLPAIRQRFPQLAVSGVITPGAEAACAASKSGRIAVIATEATIRGGAYQQALSRLRPQSQVLAIAAQLFVALAEEGITEGEIAQSIAHHYLDNAFAKRPAVERPDTLVLGCTHFPMLKRAIRAVIGTDVELIDSALTTARYVRDSLTAQGTLRRSAACAVRFLATDGAERFARIGSAFLGEPLAAQEVELINL